jgi:hypothetical protein
VHSAVYTLPFLYFYGTRLRHGSLAFHALFEWLAAIVLVATCGQASALTDIARAFAVYLAFISVYELGYLANDLLVAPRELDGRRRGPADVRAVWLVSWVVGRLAAFLVVTLMLGMHTSVAWWSFFLALAAVFSLHNAVCDREIKVSTFLWLAWFRFMAPVIFIVDPQYRMGIAFAGGMAYATFRLLGYLDSKGLLRMPGRARLRVRLSFFLLPLFAVLALARYPEARGFVVLCSFYALLGLGGATVIMFVGRERQG